MANVLKIVLLIVFTCFFSFSQAQKEDRNWVFGKYCGIDFNELSLPITFITKTNSQELSAAISNKNGSLLFYIEAGTDFYDPVNLRGKNDSIIIEGDSINTYSSITNGAIMIPAVDDSTKYYVFHIGIYDLPPICTLNVCQYLYYSIIEYSSEILTVTEKNIPIMQEPIGERLAVVKHANGRDWWILVHRLGDNNHSSCTNKFYRLLLTENGVRVDGEQDIGTPQCVFWSLAGEMVFSRQGESLALSILDQNTIDLFNFNRCTGMLSELESITGADAPLRPYGCEFSPNGRVLYVSYWNPDFSSNGGAGLVQYNLEAPDIGSSKFEITYIPSSTLDPGQLQLGPDNKVYYSMSNQSNIISSFEDSSLSVITSPNSLGAACNFQPFSFYLGDNARTTLGLPNIPNYNLGPSGIYAIKAGSTDTLVFCSNQTSDIMLGSPEMENILYSWSPSHHLSDTTIHQPLASPTKDTWYYLTVTDTMNTTSCQTRTDSVFVKVDSCVTGIGEFTSYKPLAVSVFPNPANGLLFISSSTPQFIIQQIIISDVSGKKVLQSSQTPVVVSSFAKGLYFVQTEFTNGQRVVKKILIE